MKAKEAKQILDKIPDDWEVELKIKDRHGSGSIDDDRPDAYRPPPQSHYSSSQFGDH